MPPRPTLRGRPEHVVILDGRTFLRGYQVRNLMALAAEVGEAVRIIECVCDDEIVRTRLEQDLEQGGHPAGNRTYEMYRAVKEKAEALTVPRLVVDTGVLRVEECVQRGLRYVRQDL